MNRWRYRGVVLRFQDEHLRCILITAAAVLALVLAAIVVIVEVTSVQLEQRMEEVLR